MKPSRYLVDPNDSNIREKIVTERHDVVIIGSGIAGVYTALRIPSAYDVVILTKETVDISNSVLAQGGIAVSLDKKDSPELHFRDTINAGAGLCDEETVWVLVNEAAKNIDLLCDYGVNFDRDAKPPQQLSLSREAAHSINRIIHAGDTTGKEVLDKLTAVMSTKEYIKLRECTFVLDLITEGEVCRGVLAFDEKSGYFRQYLADVVICATGGFGQLYRNTTNPDVATGDGACLAYRAGAELTDLEFIQFHPTVLYHPENKSFLISEAVRGEGGILKNIHGDRFMHRYNELAELAPRDIVSRSIFREMKRTGSDHVYLDIRFKGKKYLMNRFPNIYRTCLGYGIDMARECIPVAPAEHYCMGGIRTDVYGRTRIKGFYACGEAACNGIHGANRLASNSLLEGLVFGYKIAEEVSAIIGASTGNRDGVPQNSDPIDAGSSNGVKGCNEDELARMTGSIRDLMNEYVGIERTAEGLEHALGEVGKYAVTAAVCDDSIDISAFEFRNVLLLSRLVIEAALERRESRGAHYRRDYTATDDISWKRHIIKSIKSDKQNTEI